MRATGRIDIASAGKNDSDASDRPLEDLIDRAEKAGHDGQVSIGDLLDDFGKRSFGPIIAILALFAVVPPVGGIPGLPTTVGVITILMAVQIVFGRNHPWLPRFIRDRSVSEDKVRKLRDKADWAFRHIDKLIRPRLDWAAGSVATWIAALCCLLLGAMMPPLELLPFAAAAPGMAILLLGLGLTARDGLLMLFGFAASGGAAWLLIANIPKLF